MLRSDRRSEPDPNFRSAFRLTHSFRSRDGRGYSPLGSVKANVRSRPRIIPWDVKVERPRHVSVKDVAAQSGVSFQTTSKVLNGGGSVSEVTRARILQAASDLGYVPNLQARSLVMQQTRTVGVIASDLRDHDLSRFIGGAEQEARRQGYGVMITSVEPEGSVTEYALPAMMERRGGRRRRA